MFQLSSIRVRVLLLILPLTILSLGSLGGLSYYFASQYLIKSVNETAISISSDYSNQIKAILKEQMVELEDLATNPIIRSSSDSTQVSKTLNETYKRLGNFDAINLYTLDGKGIRINGSTTTAADRDYFKLAVSTKKSYISEPLIPRGTGKLSIMLAAPVIEDGKVIKVIAGTVSLDRVTELLKTVKFKDTGYATIIDKSGMIIAHSKMSELNGKLNIIENTVDPELKKQMPEIDKQFRQLFEAASNGKQVIGPYTDIDGVKNIGIFTLLKFSDAREWVMVVSAPEVEMTRELSLLTRNMLVITFVCILLITFLVIYASKKFIQPILWLKDEALLLAQGDLHPRQSRVQSADELGQLTIAFKQMADNLRNLIIKTQSQAELVAASSEELTAGAQQSAEASNQVAVAITQIAQGSGQQVAAMTSMSAIVDEMAANIEQISENVRMIVDIGKETSDSTTNGRQAIEKAISQMKGIGEGSGAVQYAIGELAKGSSEISEIISLIASIAGQTNLLALNAAIEAARAGEHGRGFAVVAEEVRKLAEESNKAAQRIANLIKKNEQNMNEAIVATHGNSMGVQAGIEVVQLAGNTFQSITNSVLQLSSQIQDISKSIDQIAVGSQGLVKSVHHIGRISKENAAEMETVSAATEEQSASMQEIATSSHGLANAAGELQEAVSTFRV